MTEQRKEHRRYYNISVLRVLACLGVFVCHLVPLMGIGWPDAAGAEALIARIANFGASGVYLFFIISGFLACTSDENRREKRNAQNQLQRDGQGSLQTVQDSASKKEFEKSRKNGGVLKYYMSRARRILPQYYLVILYEFLFHTFITHNATPDPQGLRWLRYIFMTSAVIPAPDNFWGNLALTWTIPLFVSFYLLAPLFLLCIRGRQGHIENSAQGTDTGWNQQLLRSGFFRSLLLYIFLFAAKYLWLSIGSEGTLSCLYYMHYFVLGMVVRYAIKERRPVLFSISIALAAVVLYIAVGTLDYFTVVSWIYAVIILVTCLAEEKRAELHQGTDPSASRSSRSAAAAPMAGKADIIKTLDTYSYDIYLAHGVVFEALTLIKPRLPLSATAMAICMFIAMITLTALGAKILHHAADLTPGNVPGITRP